MIAMLRTTRHPIADPANDASSSCSRAGGSACWIDHDVRRYASASSERTSVRTCVTRLGREADGQPGRAPGAAPAATAAMVTAPAIDAVTAGEQTEGIAPVGDGQRRPGDHDEECRLDDAAEERGDRQPDDPSAVGRDESGDLRPSFRRAESNGAAPPWRANRTGRRPQPSLRPVVIVDRGEDSSQPGRTSSQENLATAWLSRDVGQRRRSRLATSTMAVAISSGPGRRRDHVTAVTYDVGTAPTSVATAGTPHIALSIREPGIPSVALVESIDVGGVQNRADVIAGGRAGAPGHRCPQPAAGGQAAPGHRRRRAAARLGTQAHGVDGEADALLGGQRADQSPRRACCRSRPSIALAVWRSADDGGVNTAVVAGVGDHRDRATPRRRTAARSTRRRRATTRRRGRCDASARRCAPGGRGRAPRPAGSPMLR